MIIALALLAPPVVAADVQMPSPVVFANAMELGDLGRAAAWLDAGLAPGFLGSRIGSGLMIGAWEGNIELMRLFLSRGADIDQANANGETALTLAAWRGNLEVARWLVERGAHINVPARQWSPLHYAVLAGHAPMVDYLIAEGADINALSTNGSSVLMMAVYEGRQALAQKLIDLGANRAPKNDWGDGALEWAMRNNNLTIARILTKPEEFKAALNEPRAKWGKPTGSLAMSDTLRELLNMRETLLQRQMSTDAIDRRIAVERARIVRARLDQQAPETPATALEITASRQPGKAQSIRLFSGKPVVMPAGMPRNKTTSKKPDQR
ncbi:MAG: ankyrin repeat domain-containing protein [Betaproteobacteria bacterium]|nr:ankyrin repeat domain-containing protein [Betaproteobacteria bacterium]MCL2887194.1 ankyrin repeat domain-containing protein [Betaproteobacteria bacterium]